MNGNRRKDPNIAYRAWQATLMIMVALGIGGGVGNLNGVTVGNMSMVGDDTANTPQVIQMELFNIDITETDEIFTGTISGISGLWQ